MLGIHLDFLSIFCVALAAFEQSLKFTVIFQEPRICIMYDVCTCYILEHVHIISYMYDNDV